MSCSVVFKCLDLQVVDRQEVIDLLLESNSLNNTSARLANPIETCPVCRGLGVGAAKVWKCHFLVKMALRSGKIQSWGEF